MTYHSKSEMKRVERMKDDRIKELEEKLKIAIKALKFYANRYHWSDDMDSGAKIVLSAGDGWNGYEEAEQALAKIREAKI